MKHKSFKTEEKSRCDHVTGVFVLQLPNLKSAVWVRTSWWSGTCSWTAEVTPNRRATPEVRHPQISHKNNRFPLCRVFPAYRNTWAGTAFSLLSPFWKPVLWLGAQAFSTCFCGQLTVGSPGNSNGVCFFFYGFYLLSAVLFDRHWRERLHDTGQLCSSRLELLLHRLL